MGGGSTDPRKHLFESFYILVDYKELDPSPHKYSHSCKDILVQKLFQFHSNLIGIRAGVLYCTAVDLQLFVAHVVVFHPLCNDGGE